MEPIHFKWLVPQKEQVTIEGGVVKTVYVPGAKPTVYEPFDHPGLVSALVAVNDERDILRFVKRYGLLGHERIVRSKDSVGGDPVKWFLAHAESIRLVLDLIRVLQLKDDSGITDRLNAAHVADYMTDDEYKEVSAFHLEWRQQGYRNEVNTNGMEFVGLYQFAIAGNVFLKPFYTTSRDGHSGVRDHAFKLVCEMVNSNVVGVGRRLYPTAAGIQPIQAATSLLQSIWWHVAEAALLINWEASNGNGVNGAVKECEECGRPFISTHAGERFCPHPFGKASTCGNNNRKRRQRQREREQRQQKGES